MISYTMYGSDMPPPARGTEHSEDKGSREYMVYEINHVTPVLAVLYMKKISLTSK